MPWSGGTFVRSDGIRTGAAVFQDQADAGVDFEAVLLDTEAQDMADGLEECLKRTGGNVMTADLEMGGKNLNSAGGNINNVTRINLFRTGNGVVAKATASEGDPTWQLFSDEASPGDGVAIGSYQWLGRNSAAAEIVFGEIAVIRTTTTQFNEAGKVELRAQKFGVKTTILSAGSTGIRDEDDNLIQGLASALRAPVSIGGMSELDFTIRSDAARVTITCRNLNPTGGATNEQLEVLVGNSGGFVTSGYSTTTSKLTGSAVASIISASATQWQVAQNLAAASQISGTIVLERHGTGNIWMMRGSLMDAPSAAAQHVSTGEVGAGGTLDRIKIRISGNSFDTGAIAVTVE